MLCGAERRGGERSGATGWRAGHTCRVQAAWPSTAARRRPLSLQGDCLDGAAELIVKQFKQIRKVDVFFIDGKKKTAYFGESEVVEDA